MRPTLPYSREVEVAVEGALSAFSGWMAGWNSSMEHFPDGWSRDHPNNPAEGSAPVNGQIANMQWPHVRLNPDSNPAGNVSSQAICRCLRCVSDMSWLRQQGDEGFMTWKTGQVFRDSWRPPRPAEDFGWTIGENVRVVPTPVGPQPII